MGPIYRIERGRFTVSKSALKAEWQQRAATYGIDAKQHFQQALRRGDVRRGNGLEAKESLEFALAHTTNREAVVDRRDLETAALQHGMGKVDLAAVHQQMTAHEASLTLIRAGQPDHRHPQGAFTTDEMLKLERENVVLMKNRLDTHAQPIASWDEVQRWGVAKGLSQEQINAAHLALGSDKGIGAIEGFAGAAKTTTVGAVREFAEEHGYIVRGFGMTTGAVAALRDAGINARTLASLHANPLPTPSGPELWFVDESSLLATREVNRTLKAMRELGIERFTLVGDQGQHQGISAGAPMRQFLAAGLPVATLQTIRRQQDPELRQAVSVARADGRAAFDLLTAQHRVIEIPDVKKRYQRIAADYLAGHEAG